MTWLYEEALTISPAKMIVGGSPLAPRTEVEPPPSPARRTPTRSVAERRRRKPELRMGAPSSGTLARDGHRVPMAGIVVATRGVVHTRSPIEPRRRPRHGA